MGSFQWQRAIDFLNFLTLAVKYSGQEKTHGLPFAAHWPEPVTWLQCNPRGPGSEKLPVTGSKEMQLFGQEHRCSAHTWWLALPPSQGSPVLVFLKLLRGGTLPWDVCTCREEFTADPFTFPSHCGSDWLAVNTQPGVWVSGKVCWVLVLASVGHPADTLIRLVGGIIWLAAWPECHSLGKPDFLERTCTWPWGKGKAGSGEVPWKFPALQEPQVKGAWCWLTNKSAIRAAASATVTWPLLCSEHHQPSV